MPQRFLVYKYAPQCAQIVEAGQAVVLVELLSASSLEGSQALAATSFDPTAIRPDLQEVLRRQRMPLDEVGDILNFNCPFEFWF